MTMPGLKTNGCECGVRSGVRRCRLFMALLATVFLSSCHSVDDTRLPTAPVNVVFNDPGVWSVYGIGGALQHKRFIKDEQIPAGFPYAAASYTGFGGLLLVGDFTGQPVVYDLACPVECRRDVRVAVDDDLHIAACPVCHSTYAIYESYGHPLSGIAADRGYGLTHYRIMPTATGGYQITR